MPPLRLSADGPSLRKSSSLEVTDRIEVGIEADDEVAAAIEAFRDQFASEVLATEVRSGAVDGASGRAHVSVDGHQVTLTLRPM